MDIVDINGLQQTIERQAETIKGLDRATVEYTRIIAENEKAIKALKYELTETTKIMTRQDERISSLLEAQASVPTRDINGTIEAQHGLINKLKADMVTMGEKIKELGDLLAKAREANKERR